MLFLHGRHGVCYDPTDPDGWSDEWPCRAPFAEIPSQLGYDYIQQVLASQGYATVSVRVNGINAQDYRLADGGADARARSCSAPRPLGRHRRRAPGRPRPGRAGRPQPRRRGGRPGLDPDPADRAVPGRRAGADRPDRLRQPRPRRTCPTVTLLPYCDGDVSDLQGQKFTDNARDLAAGDTSLKSSVLVMGANHNYFNTEWTPGIRPAPGLRRLVRRRRRGPAAPSDPGALTAAEQRAVGTAYVAGAVHLFAGGDQAVLPMFDGSRAGSPRSATPVLSHAIGGGRDAAHAPARHRAVAGRGRRDPLLRGRGRRADASAPAAQRLGGR